MILLHLYDALFIRALGCSESCQFQFNKLQTFRENARLQTPGLYENLESIQQVSDLKYAVKMEEIR